MWFVQYTNNLPARTETFCCNNPPGFGYELVATTYLYHLCRISKAWRFKLVNAVFGGWLGYCWNFIFSNTFETFCHNKMPGLGHESVAFSHELVEMGHLGQMCWFSKTLWVRIGRLGFGWDENLPRGRLGDVRLEVTTECDKPRLSIRRDVLDLNFFSCWQLSTLITCVGFRRHDVSDSEMLFLDVDWVIVKILSSATPPRPYVVTICQVRVMIRWQLPTLVSCVGFRKLDGSDLEGLVSNVDLVSSERNSSINLVIFLIQASPSYGEEML